MIEGIVADIFWESPTVTLLERNRDEFRSEVTRLLESSEGQKQLNVRTCTAALQAIDYIAHDAVWRASSKLERDPDAVTSSNLIEELRTIAWCERAAGRLRTRRREAAHREWAGGDWYRFVDRVIRPLLARPWVPRLVYEPTSTGNRHAEDLLPSSSPISRTSGWAHPDVDSSLGTVEKGDRDWGAFIEDLGELDLPAARETAQFVSALRSIDMVPPLAVPILITSQGSQWPIGHVVDVLVVQHPLGETVGARLQRESLIPASNALQAIDLDELAREVNSWSLLLADYPGSGELGISEPTGQSASLALAAAIWGSAAGLAWNEGATATAKFEGNGGRVKPLGGTSARHQLHQKGAVAALSGFESVVVGPGSDGEMIREGATKFGKDLYIPSIEHLSEVAGPGLLLSDPFAELLEHLQDNREDTLIELIRIYLEDAEEIPNRSEIAAAIREVSVSLVQNHPDGR